MISRLSEMTEEKRNNYMKYYEDILLTGSAGFQLMRPAEHFDKFGLRFPVEFLNKIGTSLVFLPLELMAEFVDVIMKNGIDKNDAEFIFNQILDKDFNIEQSWSLLNATTIGNLAYIALNCKNERAKEIAEDLLNKIHVKQKGAVMQYINDNI